MNDFGKNHSNKLFKEPSTTKIFEIGQITNYLYSFVNHDHNVNLTKEIKIDKLEGVIDFIKKDKMIRNKILILSKLF